VKVLGGTGERRAITRGRVDDQNSLTGGKASAFQKVPTGSKSSSTRKWHRGRKKTVWEGRGKTKGRHCLGKDLAGRGGVAPPPQGQGTPVCANGQGRGPGSFSQDHGVNKPGGRRPVNAKGFEARGVMKKRHHQ